MARYSVKDLKSAIKEVNLRLSKSGSDYSYRYGSRNYYHAVDLYKGDVNIRCLDCNEPLRVLIDRVYDDYDQYLNKKD